MNSRGPQLQSTFSVIVPVFNGARTIEKCLAHLVALKGSPEIIVVDNGSSDDTIEIVKRFPVTLMREAKPGAASARNRGAQLASGSILVFNDADVYVPNDLLERFERRFEESDEKTCAVQAFYSPKLYDHNRISQYKQISQYWLMHRKRFDEMPLLGTSCVAVRRDVFTEAQGFDDSIPGATVEDADLANKFIERGYKIRADQELLVDHDSKCSLAGFYREKAERSKQFTLNSLLKMGTERRSGTQKSIRSIFANENYLSPIYVLNPLILLLVPALCFLGRPSLGVLTFLLFTGLNLSIFFSRRSVRPGFGAASFMAFRTFEAGVLGWGMLAGAMSFVVARVRR